MTKIQQSPRRLGDARLLEPTCSIPFFHASPSPEHRSPYLRPTDAIKNPVSGTPLVR
ncbi:hypothetical protein OSCI_2610015 [Kamptonema sp. PCC 6506]|nr:hypothetical protein OSCI_2610015 [Kamptonema sp. PCC 6506]